MPQLSDTNPHFPNPNSPTIQPPPSLFIHPHSHPLFTTPFTHPIPTLSTIIEKSFLLFSPSPFLLKLSDIRMPYTHTPEPVSGVRETPIRRPLDAPNTSPDAPKTSLTVTLKTRPRSTRDRDIDLTDTRSWCHLRLHRVSHSNAERMVKKR